MRSDQSAQVEVGSTKELLHRVFHLDLDSSLPLVYSLNQLINYLASTLDLAEVKLKTLWGSEGV
jgi:hypothetical protein